MRLKACGSLGILVGLGVLTAFAPVPRPTSPLATEVVSPRQHAPMQRIGLPTTNGSVTSTNWSGYAVTGTGFTYAKGSWHVPGVDCAKTPNAYSAFWVGIDGYSDSTVEQTGTVSQCVGGVAQYYAWYEFYPANSVTIASVPVTGGNIISAEVSYNGSDFKVTLTNEKTGKSYSKSAVVSGANRTSAEWIAEAPSSGGVVLPLADFVTANYGFDKTGIKNTSYASDKAVTGPISDFGTRVEEITMETTSLIKKAVPTALTTDGSSFTVAWKHI